ncbi:hypothetical protein [Halobacillus amylolyticus]|uniref:Helix-turn-helix domain-containing protein n=1 Tax=Halobacillus amylolyticus TaxID=2932259 RepID=A0ABY4HH49_9BACI|nr:hypothetical protein [Halobacillus amylolyticus]UOR13707.1 hypothetical protein MUO15_09835 [Halobacillus amylolyticus]
MKQRAVSLSLIFLGICILVGAWMVSTSINNEDKSQKELNQVKVVTDTNKQLMGHLELGEYLGINEEQLAKLLPKKDGNVTKSKIPYIQIGYEYYYPVKAIDKWLTEMESETFR